MNIYKYLLAFFIIFNGWAIKPSIAIMAQSEFIAEKRIGFYVSSKNFEFSDDYYLPIAQFLKIEEDRSYTGDIKTELLIRIGEMLTQQFPKASLADTAYFLNGDLRRGQRFIQIYQPERSRIITGTDNLDGIDYVIVLDSMRLTSRKVRSVYIRSNRMIPETVTIKKANLHLSVFDPTQASPIWNIEVCLDERNTPKVEQHFNFFNEKSPMGKFMARIFSQWWAQMQDGKSSNCD